MYIDASNIFEHMITTKTLFQNALIFIPSNDAHVSFCENKLLSDFSIVPPPPN